MVVNISPLNWMIVHCADNRYDIVHVNDLYACNQNSFHVKQKSKQMLLLLLS